MKRIFLALFALPFCFTSCNDNEVYEQEMYKNVVALISSSYHNNFTEVIPLNGEEVLGYISASVGGIYPTNKPLKIDLVDDSISFDRYNWMLYDADVSLYAKLLPKDKYTIEEYSIHIPEGARTGRTAIKLRPDGLSPDSTYFISLKAISIDGTELNPSKSNVLYKVMIYNQFASQAENSNYSMTGLQNGAITAGTKQMFPLSKNRVRVVAGIESFVSKVADIANTSMILEVDDSGKVNILPYKNINITQVDGNTRYPNTFKVEESFGRKFNVFSLCYEYTIGKNKILMEEELRMEVKNNG